MFVRRILSWQCIVFLLFSHIHAGYDAFIAVPVADMFLDKPLTNTPQLECASSHIPSHATRIHQLLYNTPVSIVRTEDSYTLVRQDEAYCSHVPNHCREMWTKRNNIIKLTTLARPIRKMCLPCGHKNTIVLIEPFQHDASTYSAGTHFVVKETTTTHYTVAYYDYKRKTCAFMHIPHHVTQPTVYPTKHLSAQEKKRRQENYVNLLKRWASQVNGAIPYVWGGTSYCERTHAELQETSCEHGKIIYTYPDLTQPYTGLDCSSLILRASRIAGIPNYCKNTRTLKDCLKRCICSNDLRNGDIIFIPGHVMIISDTKNNTIIEAAGYGRGFGKVQEIKVSDFFKNIQTFKQLFDELAQNIKLTIIDKDRKDFKDYAVADIVILSFASLWNAPSPLEFSA